MSDGRLHIAAGVIYSRDRDRVLVARRHKHAHQGGLWEFPGGKLQPGETSAQALARELFEELHLVVKHARPLIDIEYDYPDQAIRLEVWSVTEWSGSVAGREGQVIEWVPLDELSGRTFPAANQPVVAAARLPRLYLITPELADYDEDFFQRLEGLLTAGIRLVQFRDKSLQLPRAGAMLRRLVELCAAYHCRLLINGTAADASRAGADGVHLSSRELLGLTERPLDHTYLVAASCHNVLELEHAVRINVDFVVLSPVFKTSSHAVTGTLGWEGFQSLAAMASIPVYALGGLSPADMETAWQNGAQGISMISAIWNDPDPAAAVRACQV